MSQIQVVQSSLYQTVVPVGGPPGPQGESGPPGPVGIVGHVHVQSAPTPLVQVLHQLDYYPAGITSIDLGGMTVEYDRVTHPLPGVTELTYGAPFTGTVYLS